MTPFDFVKEIQVGKQDLMQDPTNEKAYVSFVVNRALSYELDCVMSANEMNSRYLVDKKLQFHYLLNTIRGRRRPFHKWAKPETSDVIDQLKEFFGFSDKKAYDALSLLSKEDLEELKTRLDKGGK